MASWMKKKDFMFASELKLFSINKIYLPLKSMSLAIVNIIQIQRSIKTLDSNVYTKVNHRTILETIVNKKPKITLKNKVYP